MVEKTTTITNEYGIDDWDIGHMMIYMVKMNYPLPKAAATLAELQLHHIQRYLRHLNGNDARPELTKKVLSVSRPYHTNAAGLDLLWMTRRK